MLVPGFHMIARDITRDCERLLALLVALVVLTLGAIAQADSRASPMPGWPETACDADALVRQRVERQDPAAFTRVSASVQVEVVARGFRLTLETERDGENGRRELEAPTCKEVVDAAVLLLMLAVDHAQGEPAPPLEPPAAFPREVATPARAPSPPARRVRATVAAAALGELGYLPRAGAGAELALGMAIARSQLELRGLWLPPVRSRPGSDGARVAISLWAARLGYCQRLSGRRLALEGCLGLELGRASGAGQDLALQRARAYLWSAGYAGLRLAISLSPKLALTVEPGLAVPFSRRRFVSTDAAGAPNEQLHTPAPVSGRLAIALKLSL